MSRGLTFTQFRALFSPLDALCFVGNGPSATSLPPSGLWVERAQCVVRFNQPQVRGFEPFVGHRTDILCLNVSQSFEGSAHRYQPRAILAITHEKEGLQDAQGLFRFAGDIPLLLIHAPDMLCMRGNAMAKPFSTGAYGVAYLSWLLEPRQVRLMGFDFFNAHSTENDHYWPDLPGPSHLHHCFEEEAQFFKKFKNQYKGEVLLRDRSAPKSSLREGRGIEFAKKKGLNQIQKLSAIFIQIGLFLRRWVYVRIHE